MLSFWNILRLQLLNFVLNVYSADGCGPASAGFERTLRFTVTDFTLPIQMAFSTDNTVRNQVPLIPRSRQSAKNTVDNLVKDAINAVFEEEGRRFLLLPFVITAILEQIKVDIEYKPMRCNNALVDKPLTDTLAYDEKKKQNCFIRDDTVTNVCQVNPGDNCAITPAGADKPAKDVPRKYLTIEGTLRTTNIFMVAWDDSQWRRIFNEVQRFLSNSRFAKNFYRVSMRYY